MGQRNGSSQQRQAIPPPPSPLTPVEAVSDSTTARGKAGRARQRQEAGPQCQGRQAQISRQTQRAQLFLERQRTGFVRQGVSGGMGEQARVAGRFK